MAVYATLRDLRNSHISYSANNTSKALEALLVRAQQDIDDYIGGPVPAFGGTKFELADLTVGQRNALKRATLAQVEYRLLQSDEWFSLDQHGYTSGPDFTSRGTLSRISPGAVSALAGTGLVQHWRTVSPT